MQIDLLLGFIYVVGIYLRVIYKLAMSRKCLFLRSHLPNYCLNCDFKELLIFSKKAVQITFFESFVPYFK